ncbi:MAG: RNA-binding transcriptional accessory protein [Clostridiales bacterium]|nr:RNA-binding transcriptional accessory protein [Clostridiales bacterium]
MMNIVEQLSEEFKLKQEYSQNIINLLDEGCTIPFIARYRKEMHGSCDDQILREFSDRLNYLRNLQKRKEEVENSIKEQEKWTDELEVALLNAKTLTEVEDIYRPYKPKRKTRASVAIAKGLEPLADIIQTQQTKDNLLSLAADYISEEKEVKTAEEALAGAKDIVAERVSDDAELRKTMRALLKEHATIKTTLLEKEGNAVYEMYAEHEEAVKSIPSHRILAINRGEKEDCLKVEIVLDEDFAKAEIEKAYIIENSTTKEIMQEIIADSYKRLLFPSLQNECRTELTDFASEQAIKMFEVNLRPLLLQSPLKNNVIMGFDPGYRMGCKVAIIDAHGEVLDTAVVYPTPPFNKTEEALIKLKALVEKHKVDIVAVGNGTASKESEIFICELIKHISRPLNYAMVNEAGASVYSASKLGAQEFPDFDVNLRSAVSIARRLQDPLAELIKIDVKSIGVGQYQHDMPQNRLTEVLTGVVEDCVNSVGVDLNTASPSLLSYVSGLNVSIAKNIVEYRKEIEHFTSREQLLKVKKLGPKAYEQCAGFLRIVGGENVLDNTAVHPESYQSAQKLLKLFNLSDNDVKDGNLETLSSLVKLKGEDAVAKEIGVGVPTLIDMVKELTKPGRDIREDMPKPVLRAELLSLENLKEGMVIKGTVRNVIDFGAFVDIGVHQDGLVHISQISNKYIKHPSDVLKVGEQLNVKVLSVDVAKKRIQLTIKDCPQND